MKRLLLMVVASALLFGCQNFNDALTDLDNRVSELEGGKIASIEQQIERINISIGDLEEVSNNLKEQIAILEKSDKATADEIAKLKAKDTELEQAISALRDYVNSLNQGTRDWVSATYATLEQFNTLASTLASLQEQLDNINGESAMALSSAIAALETSMKGWVNEQLANYYTIAQIDTKIAELRSQIESSGNDEELINELNEIKSRLESLRTELTEAYKKAISEAITENNGVIDTKIAAAIAEVNSRIDSEVSAINAKITNIESRLDDLEDKVDELLNRKLGITFEAENDAVIVKGGACKVNYTITSPEAEVYIATIAQNGWKATITETSEKEGYITVSAPDPWSDEPIIVLVSDANTTIMRTLTFTSGITEMETDAIYLDKLGKLTKIKIRTNVPYTVKPLDGWLRLHGYIQSRAEVRDEEIVLEVDENNTVTSRTGTVLLLCGEVEFARITIHQEGANNIILYTSADGQVITPYASDMPATFGAHIVSNTYENGQGIITFDRDITMVGHNAFRFCNLTSVALPKSVETIGPWSFYGCNALTKVAIPDGVTTIEESAFRECAELTEVAIGKSVESVGMTAFSGSKKLSNIVWGESLTAIGEGAFSFCYSLGSVKIPGSVTTIGEGAFKNCTGITTATIGTGVTELGWYAFMGCSLLKEVYCLPSTPPAGGYAAFYNIAPNAVIHVPNGSYESYLTAEYWSEFGTMMQRAE